MADEKKGLIYYISRIPFVNFFTILVTVLIFGFLGIMLFSDLSQEKMVQIGDVKIALLTILAGVVQYWVGSSKSSKARDEVLNNAIKNGMSTTLPTDASYADQYKNLSNVDLLVIVKDTTGKYPVAAVDAAKAILVGRTVTTEEDQQATELTKQP